jgi:hypothetical protein
MPPNPKPIAARWSQQRRWRISHERQPCMRGRVDERWERDGDAYMLEAVSPGSERDDRAVRPSRGEADRGATTKVYAVEGVPADTAREHEAD